MNNPKVVKVFLILAGLIGIYVGVGLAFFPAEMQAQSDIILGENVSHFSETRAPGTAILSASLIVLFGPFRERWRYVSLVLATLFFLSYGVGRAISLVLDGMPAQGLFITMIGELIIGLIALMFLRKEGRLDSQ